VNHGSDSMFVLKANQFFGYLHDLAIVLLVFFLLCSFIARLSRQRMVNVVTIHPSLFLF